MSYPQISRDIWATMRPSDLAKALVQTRSARSGHVRKSVHLPLAGCPRILDQSVSKSHICMREENVPNTMIVADDAAGHDRRLACRFRSMDTRAAKYRHKR